MTIEDLKKRNLIVLECISGSKAYGLDTASSDTDIKGVFILPKKDFYGLEYVAQVNNPTNDIVYYELGRYLELLSLNNPNILELLNTPESAILYKDPLLNQIDSKLILSKLCKNTFGKFALSQIKKAKGLKKKIVNPVQKERKTVLSFCYVTHNHGSIPLEKYLDQYGLNQKFCGLAKIPHMRDVYGLYYDDHSTYQGIFKNEFSNDIRLSSIPKEAEQMALLYFNKDGYSKYCKDYKEYWDWVENRNEVRYEKTQEHGKNYDAKNLMHTFRLLEMAIEIGSIQEIIVKRPNRDFLLDIKEGKFEYDELMTMAQHLQIELEDVFEKSDLPETPNLDYIQNLAFELRDKYYQDSERFG